MKGATSCRDHPSLRWCSPHEALAPHRRRAAGTVSRQGPANRFELVAGTWPIEPGQSVWVEYRVDAGPTQRSTGMCRRSCETTPCRTRRCGPSPRPSRGSPGDILQVRTSCPGQLRWRIDDGDWVAADLVAAGGVMPGRASTRSRSVRFRRRAGACGSIPLQASRLSRNRSVLSRGRAAGLARSDVTHRLHDRDVTAPG